MTGKDIAKITFNLAIIYVIGGVILAGVYAYTSPIIFKIQKEEKERARQKMMPLHLIVNAPSDAHVKIGELIPDAQPTEVEGQLDAEVDMYEKELKKLVKKIKKSGATAVEERSDFTTEKAGDWEPHHKHAEYFTVLRDGEQVGYLVESYGKGYSSYPNVLVAIDNDLVVTKVNVLGHAETPGLGDEIEVPEFKDMFRGKDLDHLVVIKGETEDKIQAITGATISTRAVTEGVRLAVELLMEQQAGEEDAPMVEGEAPMAEEGEGDAGH